MKLAIVLAIGIAAGYSFGWKDAKKHKVTIVERTIDRVGGKTRDQYRTDVDARMEKLEGP